MKGKTFLYVSLIADILIAVSKFVAAAITGSSSMRAEGIHSVIDAGSQLMLIWEVSSEMTIELHDSFTHKKEDLCCFPLIKFKNTTLLILFTII